MAAIKNNTARLFVINGVALVPGRTVNVEWTRADIEAYPSFCNAVDAGLIEFIDDMPIDNSDDTNTDDTNTDGVNGDTDGSKENHKPFKDMTVSELKNFAIEKGIDLRSDAKKAEIIAVLENV
ncbi:hypothetical protein [Veillonella caviae]|uniref:hypothetical protein n=1 Tax=Veillonella caviae TaxID=248316 RepID=UPI0023EFD8EC|nr:hypothetical protein [Veillonella caviae]MCI6406976.1 hypothetical protein [Veillonella caviae]MDY6224372.1 hypothetical protein [Veillonella caviae]